ncbi:MAG TPA: hypothetical protein VHB27_03660 [Rhodopila sp.]|uniref:hypothetical protein n=1 Tax=Rhodopila sp. TaxID=2480087 RepID=UPI002CC48BD3|nr:hypothetical protein [Rhodopila sp.]HVY14298.1 hypothetical protein [Rhodopila sp.]
MAAPPGIADLKAELLQAWDTRGQPAPEPGSNAASFQAAISRRPKSGLAIGHSLTGTGRPRLELRVTAAGGPNRIKAESLAARARRADVETRLIVQPPPIIPLLSASATANIKIPGKRRPLHIGASVAHGMNDGAGSIGGFVKLPDGTVSILSCSHVLARRPGGKVKPGDAILQPGPPDPRVPANEVAFLTRAFAPLISRQRDNLDAAVARVADGQAHMGNRLPDHDCIPQPLRGQPLGLPLEDDEGILDQRVVKIGRSTGFTAGAVINSLDFDNLAAQFGPDGPIYLFNGVYELLWDKDEAPFTAGGDSGAMILTEDGLRPVGLHFCAVGNQDGSRVSYVVPWARIRTILGIEWHA